MGFFSAWEDQKQKRTSAESERDFFKKQSAYNQKRIDYLSDRATNQSAGIAVTTSNISGIGNVSGAGSGTIIGSIQGGNNQIGSGNIQFNKPPPEILQRTLVSLNVATNGHFETTFTLIVAHYDDDYDKTSMRVNAFPGLISAVEFSNKTSMVAAGGKLGILVNVVLSTSNKCEESNFVFFVETAENQPLSPLQK